MRIRKETIEKWREGIAANSPVVQQIGQGADGGKHGRGEENGPNAAPRREGVKRNGGERIKQGNRAGVFNCEGEAGDERGKREATGEVHERRCGMGANAKAKR